MKNKFEIKPFIVITLITSVWIHFGEVLRALFVVFPRMEAFFAGRIALNGLDQFNLAIAMIWGGWDTLLTAILVFTFWLCAQAFGNNLKSVLISGTTTSLATIGIFWIATVNSGLGEWSTAFILFPIAWAELVIGAWIASKLYARKT